MRKLLCAKFGPMLIMFLVLSSVAAASSFHVVVGSFSESFAAWNVANAMEKHFPGAAVKYDDDLKLHHVSVFETNRYDVAKAFRDDLEREKGLSNAWIYAVFNATDAPPSEVDAGQGPISMELYTGGTILLSSADNSYFGVTNGGIRKGQRAETSRLPFTFVARTSNGIEIPGRVALLDSRGTAVYSVKTGDVVNFSGQYQDQALTVVFQSRGYSPAAKHVNLGTLGGASDIHQNDEGAWVVALRAERLSADRIVLSFKDLFHDETAVLRSQRREAIDLIIALVNSRRARQIKIDVHSDGEEKRKAVLPGGRDYFNVSQGSEKTVSGKQLTRERVETLIGYMTSQGIEKNRIQGLGWGGIDPIVRGSEIDTSANDRVEIRLFFDAGK